MGKGPSYLIKVTSSTKIWPGELTFSSTNVDLFNNQTYGALKLFVNVELKKAAFKYFHPKDLANKEEEFEDAWQAKDAELHFEAEIKNRNYPYDKSIEEINLTRKISELAYSYDVKRELKLTGELDQKISDPHQDDARKFPAEPPGKRLTSEEEYRLDEARAKEFEGNPEELTKYLDGGRCRKKHIEGEESEHLPSV